MILDLTFNKEKDRNIVENKNLIKAEIANDTICFEYSLMNENRDSEKNSIL